MPRKARIHYRHSFHHVMLRGNNRKNIFIQNEDYQHFIECMSVAANTYHFKVHLYCLMTNHIHLVVEVGDIPISRIMQSISTGFAKWHNKKYEKIGHLFQGRFKSKLISSDDYLIELCYYIHMNPIAARMCRSLDEYPWSSHQGYKTRKISSFLTTDYICKLISDHFDKTVGYEQFMAGYGQNSFKPSFCKFNEDGSLDIFNDVGSRLRNKPSLALENISLNVIANVVCKKLQVSLASIESDSQTKRVSLARSMIAYFAHYHAKYTFEDIAAVVCRQPSSVSKTLCRHLKLVATQREVSCALAAIERELSMSDMDRWNS